MESQIFAIIEQQEQTFQARHKVTYEKIKYVFVLLRKCVDSTSWLQETTPFLFTKWAESFKNRIEKCVQWAETNRDVLCQLFENVDMIDFCCERFLYCKELSDCMGVVRMGNPLRNKIEPENAIITKFCCLCSPGDIVHEYNNNGDRKLLFVFRSLSAEDTRVLRERGGIECRNRKCMPERESWQHRKTDEWQERSDDDWLVNSALCHILHGSSKSIPAERRKLLGEWISTTKNLSITIKFSGILQDIALISIKDIAREIRDVKEPIVANSMIQLSKNYSSFDQKDIDDILTFSTRSEEVLIHDRVPPKNVRILTPRMTCCKLWPFMDDSDFQLTRAEAARQQLVLTKLVELNGIPGFAVHRSDPDLDNAVFPHPEDLENTCISDIFELVRTVGGPNDRMSLCRLKRDLRRIKSGTVYILKQSKPNIGENLTTMVTDDVMRLQLRLSWTANSIYQLFQTQEAHAITPRCCLYEYRGTIDDFEALEYRDSGVSNCAGTRGAPFWHGSFMLCRYEDPSLAEKELDKDLHLAFDRFEELLLGNALADCLLGVALVGAGGSVRASNAGRIGLRHFLGCDSQLLRLPSALEHALGSPVYVSNVDRFMQLEAFFEDLGERLCSPAAVPSCAQMLRRFSAQEGAIMEQVVALGCLLDNSTGPTLQDSSCEIRYEACLESRVRILRELASDFEAVVQKHNSAEEAVRSCLAKVRKNFHLNRVSILFADPLCAIKQQDPIHFSEEQVKFYSGGVQQNLAQSLHLCQVLSQMQKPEPDIRPDLKVATLESLVSAACNYDVLILNVNVDIEERGVITARMLLETSTDGLAGNPGETDFVVIEKFESSRFMKLSRNMAKKLRKAGKPLALRDLVESMPGYTERDVKELVASAPRKRFELSACGTRVSAVYGHRDRQEFAEDEYEWLKAEEIEGNGLYYCKREIWNTIWKNGGISKDRGNRHFIHVWTRQSPKLNRLFAEHQVLIEIDLGAAVRDGLAFCKKQDVDGRQSDREIIFTPGFDGVLPIKYFRRALSPDGTVLWKQEGLCHAYDTTSLQSTLMYRLNQSFVKVLLMLSRGSLRGKAKWVPELRKNIGSTLRFDVLIVDGPEQPAVLFVRCFVSALARFKTSSEALLDAKQAYRREQGSEPVDQAYGGASWADADDGVLAIDYIEASDKMRSQPVLVPFESSKKSNIFQSRDTRAEWESIKSPVIYGRQREISTILQKREEIVNVWGPAQCGKSVLAFELELYCKYRHHKSTVLRVETEAQDSSCLKGNLWNLIKRLASESRLNLQSGKHTLDAANSTEDDSYVEHARDASSSSSVRLLIIDAGRTNKDLLIFSFNSSDLLKHLRESSVEKVVVFSQDKLVDLCLREECFLPLSHLDENAAASFFNEIRCGQGYPYCDTAPSHVASASARRIENRDQDRERVKPVLNALLQRSDATVAGSIMHGISPTLIRPLALLPNGMFSDIVDAACAERLDTESLICQLFRSLGPHAQQALRACSVIPDIFNTSYLKDFDQWTKECWENFLLVELSPAGAHSPYYDMQHGEHRAKSMLEFLLKTGIVGNAFPLRSWALDGTLKCTQQDSCDLFDFLVNRGVVLEVQKDKYYAVSSEFRNFCLNSLIEIEKKLPSYRSVRMLQKKQVLLAIIADLFKISVSTTSGQKEFNMHFKNWRWAVDECFYQVMNSVDLRTANKNAVVRLKELDQQVSPYDFDRLQELSRSKQELLSKQALETLNCIEWTTAFSNLLWVVRRILTTLVPMDVVERWTNGIITIIKTLNECEDVGHLTAEQRIRLRLAYNKPLYIRTSSKLNEYNPNTFQESIDSCREILNDLARAGDSQDAIFHKDAVVFEGMPETARNSDNKKRMYSLQESLATVKIETLLLQGAIHSWKRGDDNSTYDPTLASNLFEQALVCWKQVSPKTVTERIKDTGAISNREFVFLWVEIKNQIGNVHVFSETCEKSMSLDKPSEHEQLYDAFKTHLWMQASMPSAYSRCQHNIAVFVHMKMKASELSASEIQAKYEQIEELLVAAHKGRKMQLDVTSIRSILYLCDTLVRLIKIREERQKIEAKVSDDSKRFMMRDYADRRQAYRLLKRLHERERKEEIKLPPRAHTYGHEMRRSKYFKRGCIVPSSLVSLGTSLLLYIDATGDVLSKQHIEDWKDRNDYSALLDDVFEGRDLMDVLGKMVTELFDTLKDYSKNGIKDASEDILDFVRGALVVFMAAMDMTNREPEWSRTADERHHDFLSSCQREGSARGSSQKYHTRIALKHLCRELFLPVSDPRERLQVLCGCLTTELHWKLSPSMQSTPIDSKAPSASRQDTSFRLRASERHMMVPQSILISPERFQSPARTSSEVLRHGSLGASPHYLGADVMSPSNQPLENPSVTLWERGLSPPCPSRRQRSDSASSLLSSASGRVKNRQELVYTSLTRTVFAWALVRVMTDVAYRLAVASDWLALRERLKKSLSITGRHYLPPAWRIHCDQDTKGLISSLNASNQQLEVGVTYEETCKAKAVVERITNVWKLLNASGKAKFEGIVEVLKRYLKQGPGVDSSQVLICILLTNLISK